MNKINEFWKYWKKKSPIEKRAISSIYQAINFLFANIQKKDIISIYIKGSFVTREMNKKSDIDIVPITKDNWSMKKLQNIRNKNKEMLKPSELLPISLTELKQNENSKHHDKLKGKPDIFLRDLAHHKLIYGKELDPSKFPIRNTQTIFRSHIRVFKKRFIPFYLKGKVGFSGIIKQVFWLSYNEQKILGKSPPRTWKGLNKFIKDKKHIIHLAYKYRIHPTKNKLKRAKFIKKLNEYLKSLK